MLFELFKVFFTIGLFTIGGGYAMIPLIQSEVLAKGWLQETDLINFIAVSESTPGSLAVNLSTYIGAEKGGFGGALIATLGVILPSFIIILIIARFYEKFKENKILSGCMTGLRPAVVGLIGAAAVSLSSAVFFPSGLSVESVMGYSFICSALIFILMLILVFKKLHPIAIILFSAVLGIITGYAPSLFK